MKQLKSVSELRNSLPFETKTTNSQLRHLARIEGRIDFNVYLPSKGRNLQRGFVWTLAQKRELIKSIILGRHIPSIAYIVVPIPNSSEDMFQIIDGKQRLSAAIDFVKDRFTIVLEEQEFLFSQLPQDYQVAISGHFFSCISAFEELDKPISDDSKSLWFDLINYSGTPMDEEHINSTD